VARQNVLRLFSPLIHSVHVQRTCPFYHLPASLPPAQIKPPPPTGMRSIQAPTSQINLRYRRRLCKRRSFRRRRGSLRVGLGSAGLWVDCVCTGRMIDNGFRMLCNVTWIAAVKLVSSPPVKYNQGQCITWKEVRPSQGQNQCYITQNIEKLKFRCGEGEDNNS